MQARNVKWVMFLFLGLAFSIDVFAAACTGTYTSGLTGSLTQCVKSDKYNNDRPKDVDDDKPFGFGIGTDTGKDGWIQLDKTDGPSSSVFTLTAPKKPSEAWEITSNGANLWDIYSGAMLTFKSGEKFGNYEAVLLTAGSLKGTFDLGKQDLSHATLWGTNAIPPAAVPLPAAAWLFGSALLGMAGVGYRRNRAKTV
jgi:hypothetical protein